MGERTRHLLRSALMAAFVGGAAWVFAYQWIRLEPRTVIHTLRTLPLSSVVLAVLCAALGHLAITGYDFVACRTLGITLPYWKIAAAAFIGSAFGMNAGYPLLTGTPFRLRIYALWGLSAAEVLKAVAGSALAYWTGSLAMAGWVLLLLPPGGLLEQTGLDGRYLGLALLALWGLAMASGFLRRFLPEATRWKVLLPRRRWILAGLCVSGLDWSLASATLFFLLPPAPNLRFFTVLGVYVPAALGVWLLQIPAGIGVLDTAVLFLLPGGADPAPVLGGLLLFRGVYYLLPLLVAGLLFFGLEGRGHLRSRRRYLKSLLHPEGERQTVGPGGP